MTVTANRTPKREKAVWKLEVELSKQYIVPCKLTDGGHVVAEHAVWL